MDLQAVEVGGRTLAYRRAGSGQPLVLLHGGWSDSREWWLQHEALADEFDVIAPDSPGCGGSSDAAPTDRLPAYADAVADLVRALDLSPVHLLGLSFGGGLAIEVFHRHRALVRSLLLCSAYAGWAGSLPAEEVEARLRRVLAEASEPAETWAAGYLDSFFASEVPDDVRDRTLEIMLDVRPGSVEPMLLGFAEADLRPVLPTIDVPTLLLYGELDVRAPRAVADTLHAGIPGSELVVLPGVGHASNAEAPQAFNDAVRRFLGGVDG